MDLGKLLPDPSGEENLQEWRVPICVYERNGNKTFRVVSVYEDEGVLCIDIEVPKD